jgi:hypothetical protein
VWRSDSRYFVEKKVSKSRRIVPEVHVDLVAFDLVREAAADAVEVLLPLGHAWNRTAFRDAFRMRLGRAYSASIHLTLSTSVSTARRIGSDSFGHAPTILARFGSTKNAPDFAPPGYSGLAQHLSELAG